MHWAQQKSVIFEERALVREKFPEYNKSLLSYHETRKSDKQR